MKEGAYDVGALAGLPVLADWRMPKVASFAVFATSFEIMSTCVAICLS